MTSGDIDDIYVLARRELRDMRERLEKAQHEIEELTVRADARWTAHRSWAAKGLPVPRIEMNLALECEGPKAVTPGYITAIIATSYLVLRQRDDGGRHCEAIPLGQTRIAGGWTSVDRALFVAGGLPLYYPMHDGAVALETAEQLKLLLYATYEQLAFEVFLLEGKIKMKRVG